MEFVGRIKQVLPERRGTSQRTNNEWVALPFIFEYFENENDRYADTVLLETFDTNIQPYIKEGLEVRVGFGHRTREYEGKVYNELRMYKIESIKKQQLAPQPQGAFGQAIAPQSQIVYPQPQAQNPFPPQTQEGGGDGLPF